jgi:hypothetical protein
MAGGARVGAGRHADPNALNRDRKSDTITWTNLAPSGPEITPVWPLSRPTKRESDLWKREWQRPQARQWLAGGLETQVAIYIRTLRDAERPHAPVACRTLLARQEDALGISIAGLARLRWVIAEAQTAPATPIPGRQAQSGPSARDRLRLVRDGPS